MKKKCPHCGKNIEQDDGRDSLTAALLLVASGIAYGIWYAWQAGVFG